VPHSSFCGKGILCIFFGGSYNLQASPAHHLFHHFFCLHVFSRLHQSFCRAFRLSEVNWKKIDFWFGRTCTVSEKVRIEAGKMFYGGRGPKGHSGPIDSFFKT